MYVVYILVYISYRGVIVLQQLYSEQARSFLYVLRMTLM
jgi:hypothetical protein